MSNPDFLLDRIAELPQYTNKCRIKRNLLFTLLRPQIQYVDNVRDQIFAEHQKLSGATETIEYLGRKYQGDMFGITKSLHGSLHTRMDQWIVMNRNTSLLITMLDNYLGAALVKAKNWHDLRVMLPAPMHESALELCESFLPRMVAHCWKHEPTLSKGAIASFHERHEGPVVQMQVLVLNQLTS